MPLFLSAGINRLTVAGTTGTLPLDRVRTARSNAPTNRIEAETGTLTGAATANGAFTFASGKVVTGVGDGSGNALTLKVTAQRAGEHIVVIRYANAEESIPTHYNPDPVARHADISINGQPAQRVLFPTTFHFDQFRDLAVPVGLAAGSNTITFTSQQLPDWDGTTYNQFGQRSKYAGSQLTSSTSGARGCRSVASTGTGRRRALLPADQLKTRAASIRSPRFHSVLGDGSSCSACLVERGRSRLSAAAQLASRFRASCDGESGSAV
ncbi:MAG: hypothetical protein QOI78_9431 [Actinomycetota bacterium]|nr:hypothetical protein [Actinomycetota bacterium]